MNKIMTPSEPLDLACGQFADAFPTQEYRDDTERHAQVSDRKLSFGMVSVALTYRDQKEQEDFFLAADNSILGSFGNPSANIRTWDSDHYMAHYDFDRISGLVVVNNYSFPKDEVRDMTHEDESVLGLSYATRGMARSGHRLLTAAGIERLADDLQDAFAAV